MLLAIDSSRIARKKKVHLAKKNTAERKPKKVSDNTVIKREKNKAPEI